MKAEDFNFDLPASLIAQYPLENRTSSRLMCFNRANNQVSHRLFSDILDCLSQLDLLIFNNTKVIPARLYGNKSSGGKIELLVERVINQSELWAHIKSSNAPKVGAKLIFGENYQLEVFARCDDIFECRMLSGDVFTMLDDLGHMPLPPYIKRLDERSDLTRYQTVYAKEKGAVAAPTAGLHFDELLLKAIQEKGIASAELTLHVGAGTFQPVRVDNILDHKMHSELLTINQKLCDQVQKTKEQGGRVIAVGTTSVRSLEAVASLGGLKPYCGETDIFIYPGFEFKVIDAMITNFHLPESTLLMLISAFVGRETALELYHEAIAEKYRFFSYGDAMFLS